MKKQKHPDQFIRLSKVVCKKINNEVKPTSASIRELKRDEYFIERGYSITGDAPKDFCRVFIEGECRKTNPKTWPLFIAKTGHKHYPTESVVEYMNNRIGECLGMKMAASNLFIANNQVRFFSKYFLSRNKGQELVHGANIYAGYLSDDQFVESIEAEKQEHDFFTLQFTKEALIGVFVDHGEQLFSDFIQMLLLDAFIGCNDRHMYNWGVVRNVGGDHHPYFSPIYDSARSLFWNETEEKLRTWNQSSETRIKMIKNYCEKSSAKTGVESVGKVNHFKLVEQIVQRMFADEENVREFFSAQNYDIVIEMIQGEFNNLLTDLRMGFIIESLRYRQNKFADILV